MENPETFNDPDLLALWRKLAQKVDERNAEMAEQFEGGKTVKLRLDSAPTRFTCPSCGWAERGD